MFTTTYTKRKAEHMTQTAQIHYGKENLNLSAELSKTPFTKMFEIQNRHCTILTQTKHNTLVIVDGYQVVIPSGNLFKPHTFKRDHMPRPWDTDTDDTELFSGDNREALEVLCADDMKFYRQSDRRLIANRLAPVKTLNTHERWFDFEVAGKVRNFGEGYLGDMHYQGSMSGLNRMIVEDCYHANGRIMRPAPAIPSKPTHLRAEWIMKKARRYDEQKRRYVKTVDMVEADILADAFRTLEATPKMVNHFLKQIRTGEIANPVEYFTAFAFAVAEVEAPAVDCERPQLSTGYNDETPALYSANLKRRMDLEDAKDENAHIEIDDRVLAPSRELAYTAIGNTKDQDGWIETQPAWLRRAIKAIYACQTPEKLAAFAKFAMKDERVNAAAPIIKMVLWGHYRARRAQFRKEHETSQNGRATRLIMEAIAKADQTGLVKLSKWVHGVKDGHVKSKSGFRPTKEALRQIWRTYYKRKAQLNHTA